MKIEAIIFDLDGTIWDSSQSISVAWNNVFIKNKLNYQLNKNDIKKNLGKTNEELATIYFSDLKKEKQEFLMQECANEENIVIKKYGGELFDSVINTLKKFFKRLLKIGTEKDKDDVITEIKEYHKNNLYDNEDLHYIADNTTRKEEIKDYLYKKNYECDDRNFDI